MMMKQARAGGPSSRFSRERQRERERKWFGKCYFSRNALTLCLGIVPFAETTEMENGNGNTQKETRKKQSRASYSTASRNSTVFYFVHSFFYF